MSPGDKFQRHLAMKIGTNVIEFWAWVITFAMYQSKPGVKCFSPWKHLSIYWSHIDAVNLWWGTICCPAKKNKHLHFYIVSETPIQRNYYFSGFYPREAKWSGLKNDFVVVVVFVRQFQKSSCFVTFRREKFSKTKFWNSSPFVYSWRLPEFRDLYPFIEIVLLFLIIICFRTPLILFSRLYITYNKYQWILDAIWKGI